MRIKQIRVDNFKSLVDFELPFAKFNCIVGLNGSGKSTVLQFFDFLSQQVKGDFKEWLKKRHWDKSDINSKLTKKLNVNFEVLFEDAEIGEIHWVASFNRKNLRCSLERVSWDGNVILKVEDGNYSTSHMKMSVPIPFDYQGSLMSQIKESQLPLQVLKLKKCMEEIHALDLLAPELLRQRTREAG